MCTYDMVSRLRYDTVHHDMVSRLRYDTVHHDSASVESIQCVSTKLTPI